MRNRLIEKLSKSKKGSLGYTLTELLVVIGILAVLCAIAIPSIITISRALKFRQRNDYAKTIFLAAQANLSEMRSDGSLSMVQAGLDDTNRKAAGKSSFPSGESWSNQYYYVIGSDATQYAIVLPVNSVEGSIRNKQVIIEYNPYSGNVYSVFYSEEDEDIYGPYAGTGLPRDKAGRKQMMLGYYDGSGLANQELELQETKAELKFVNGEEGIIQVRVPMPAKYYSNFNTFADGLSVELTITSDSDTTKQITVPIKTAKEANPGADDTNQAGTGAASTLSFTAGAVDVAEDNSEITLDTTDKEVTCTVENGNTMVVSYVLDSLIDYGSFANKAISGQQTSDDPKHLTQIADESGFAILPGENVTVTAKVKFAGEDMELNIESGILPGINPLFEYLEPGTTAGKYVLAISNGRNLQNLNILSPSVAANVETVVFTGDVDWNDTVEYYNDKYGQYPTGTDTSSTKTYSNTGESPARCLPYFVPISNEALLGSAYFDTSSSDPRPTLQYSHDVDTSTGSLRPVDHADIVGNGNHVIGLNIDATKCESQTVAGTLSDGYYVSKSSYTYKSASGLNVTMTNHQRVNYYFTGLFAYANTYIDGLNIVNPIVKGHPFSGSETTATGALLGASGFNSLVTNCGVYIDKSDKNYHPFDFKPMPYSADQTQTWYGVSGQGAVGGLVGYAKSHRTASGDLTDNASELAFSYCFAAVPVSGDMRGNKSIPYGYTNGVGGFIGNSTLTNFYSCYASGDVYATRCYVWEAKEREQNDMGLGFIGGIIDEILPSTVLISEIMEYDGYYSMGAGGFVGTSHGTRYTNCFSTGNVTGYSASGSANTEAGVGGFVGIMSFDERFTYGVGNYTQEIRQLTVFDSCYSVGKATIDKVEKENFSGANARILRYSGSIYADYYKLLAPYYVSNGGKAPSYPTSFPGNPTIADLYYASYYIYKDSYYLSRNYEAGKDTNIVSNQCASVVSYDVLTNLSMNHTDAGKENVDDSWLDQRISDIGQFYKVGFVGDWLSGLIKGQSFIGLEWFEEFFNNLEKPYKDFFGNPYVSFILYGDSILDNWLDLLRGKYQKNYWEGVLTDVYMSELQEGFQSLDWRPANAANTHPYTMSGSYPFSKLIDMPYYGDWPTQPQAAGIAYYEDYLSTDGSSDQGIFFDSEGTSTLKNSSDMENFTLVSDGYVILTVSERDKVSVKVGDGTERELYPSENFQYSPGGENASYVYQGFFPLTKEILEEAASEILKEDSQNETAEQFYAKLSVRVITQDSKETVYVFYFNPNVAKSNINPANGKVASAPSTIPSQISIRTARQLAALSTASGSWAKTYGTGENIRPYRYVQELDIDFASYTASGYDTDSNYNQIVDATEILEAIAGAEPIGTAENPFNASYSGTADKHVISRDVLKTDSNGKKTVQTDSLFGVIGADGSVENLTVNTGVTVEDDRTICVSVGSSNADSVGIVANEVKGTLRNIDLKLTDTVIVTAKENAGLAAGKISGKLTNVNVTSQSIASVIAPNAGGVVGLVACEAGDSDSTAAETAVTAPTIADCGIRFTGTLMLDGTNCGGFAGNSSGSAKNVTVTLSGLTADSDGFVGGYAGALSGSENAKSEVDSCTVTLNGTVSGPVLGGFAGSAENVKVSGSAVNVNGSLMAPTAAGFIGNALTGAQIQNSKANVSGTIRGDESAAGFVGGMAYGSTFTACNATVSGSITAPHAAGFAVTVDGIVNSCFTTLNNGGITGTATAAGFARTVSATGNVYGTGGSGVVGSGSITAPTAAGFAIAVSGNVAAGRVTPAYSQTRAAYLDKTTGYSKLAITATAAAEDTSAANTAVGFAVTVENGASVSNCDALGTITGAKVSCFADTNAGTIEGCMANVVVPADKNCYFVADNSGNVTNCYGWFGDGEMTTNLSNFTVAGSCKSSYFVDIDVPVDEESTTPSVVLYTSGGEKEEMTPTALAAYDASKLGTSWYEAKRFAAYPFSQSLRDGYPYPMLRQHSGNWAATPQYAYGVIYYEVNEDGSLSYRVEDLSNHDYTLEDKLLSTDGFITSDGTIANTGYAIFCHSTGDVIVKDMNGAVISDAVGEVPTDDSALTAALNTIAAGLGGKGSYNVYPLNAVGQVVVSGSVDDSGEEATEGDPSDSGANTNGTAQVVTWYANAINVTGNTYEIRTGEQFSNIRNMSDVNFRQTHDLTLADKFEAIPSFGGSYDGNALAISAGTVNGLINNVTGTIKKMNFAAEEATGNIFGAVVNPGTVQNSTISVAKAGSSVIGTVSGIVSENNISVTMDNVSDANFGIAASEVTSVGKLTKNIVSGTVNVTRTNSDTSVIGGLAGVNAGEISGGSANVTINYTQASEDNAVIGGLVGRMDGGSISNVSVSGAVNLLPADANANGRIYIIGGAIGKDNGNATYSDVTSEVSLSNNWAESIDPCIFLESPDKFCQDMGNGPVGMFVGYVGNGIFTYCYSTVEDTNLGVVDTYQFLGQIAVSQVTLEDSDSVKWFSREEKDQITYSYPVNDANMAAVAVDNDFKTPEDNFCCNATLDNCTFYSDGTLHNQSIRTTEYYYQGVQQDIAGGYKAATVGLIPNYGNAITTVKYKDLYNSGKTDVPQKTDYYYQVSSDKYERVSVSVSVSVRVNGRKEYYTYKLYIGDSNADPIECQETQKLDSTIKDSNGNNIPLYKPTFTLSSEIPNNIESKGYLITGSDLFTSIGYSYMFDGSGNGVEIKLDENDILTTRNSNDQLTLWTVNKNNQWYTKKSNGLYDYYEYLYLAGQSLTSVWTPNTITLSEANGGFSLQGQNYSTQTGKYLCFENNKFKTNTQGTVFLYEVYTVEGSNKYVFTYEGLNNSICVAEITVLSQSEAPSEDEMLLPLLDEAADKTAEETTQSAAETTNSSGNLAGGEGGNEET